jgi:hypothetical protein
MRFAAGALTRALSRGCSLSIQRSPQAVFLSPQRNSPVHAMLSSSVLLRCAPVATPSTSRSFVVSSPAQADKGCAAEVANAQPKGFYDMSNESLLMFCATGDFAARKERLLREIMAVDNISWADAQLVLNKIDEDNAKGMWFATLPYKAGLVTAVGAAAISIPMVFHLDTALWFNEHYVTTEVADDKDLETWLEVGSWTWGWNEPVLGTVSFVLLALQFARNQMINLGAKPYSQAVKAYRSKRLRKLYPQYHPLIITEFADADDYESGSFAKEPDTGYHVDHPKPWA